VLVSEVMLQQTPVNRVIPAWEKWLARWPTPTDLAGEPAGEAVIMWDRLGYPRRALRLHAAATAIRDRHQGVLPDDYESLLALPGVGDYTAAAIMAFAFRQRRAVLDTNVRRVLARAWYGQAYPKSSSANRAERDELAATLPATGEAAAVFSEAIMELGALVCTARSPACEQCPLMSSCSWFAAGRPANATPPNRQAKFAGSDREVRGRILQLVRSTPTGVLQAEIDLTWPNAAQLRRAQDSLLADGLLIGGADGRYSLPGGNC
jgi:A/G-specific adenine glycosylase